MTVLSIFSLKFKAGLLDFIVHNGHVSRFSEQHISTGGEKMQLKNC